MSFFKVTVLMLGMLSTHSVVAEQPILSASDLDIVQKSRQIISDSSALQKPAWMNEYSSNKSIGMTEKGMKRWAPVVNDIAQDGQDFVLNTIQDTYNILEQDKGNIKTISHGNRDVNSPLKTDEELYYFVSFSQSEAELKDILTASSLADARVVLRGIRPTDKTINQTAKAIYNIGKAILPTPKVAIDPRLFSIFDINSVPAMVYRKGDKYVKADGLSSTDWFLEQARIQSDGVSDLGNISMTYDILEKDMILEMQARTAAVDWDSKKKKVVKNYTDSLPFFNIPVATKDHSYSIDPRVKFNKDITAKDGTLIARKGQVINPIDRFPGNGLTLFIFDGLSDVQRELVKEKVKIAKGNIGLLVTGIDKDKGLDFIGDLRREFKRPVYLVQQRMIQRFQIQHVPTQVYLGNGNITVNEYGIAPQPDTKLKTP